MEKEKTEGDIIEVEEGDKEFLTAEEKEKISTKRKKVLLFVVGILVGFTLKGTILKSYVIGFDDYKLDNYKSDFSFVKEEKPTPIKEEVGNSENVEAPATTNNSVEGASCN